MNQDQLFQKAAMYDLLACYYKYSDPTLHVKYYEKHLKYMNKALQTVRGSSQQGGLAYVRALHAAPDAPAVDIFVNGNRVLTNVKFGQISDYLPLPAGSYHIDIYPTGNQTTTVISKKVKVEPNQVTTLAAVGLGNSLRLLPYSDDPFVPNNETKVRFIHLSPDAPAVDIAVKGGDVIFDNISYKQATDYLGLTPMTVNLEVRIAGTKDVVLDVPNVSLRPNESYTIFALGKASGSPELEAKLVKG